MPRSKIAKKTTIWHLKIIPMKHQVSILKTITLKRFSKSKARPIMILPEVSTEV